MSDRLRVLIVDNASEHARLVGDCLRAGGAWPDAEFQTARSYEEALRACEARAFDLAFFDDWLGERDGLTLLRDLRLRGIDTPVIMLTSRGAEDVAVQAMKAGAADYLNMTNLTAESLERAIRYALAIHAEGRQRQQAEAALRASEERFRALVENSSDAVMLLDANGRILYIAPSFERHLGWKPPDLFGRLITEFVHPDDRPMIRERLAESVGEPGAPLTAEVRFKHADGSWRIMEGVGTNHLDQPSVHAIVVNARDVSERRRLEDQLRQSQKMEAVGKLAGGVAHDFNNLLTAILGYANLILDDLPDEGPLRKDLEEIRSAGERAASLTRQLLAFSRRQMLQPQIVNVNNLVRHMEKLLRRSISEDVELLTALAPDLLPVKVDPASIEQVIVNLAVNARDAMPTGGRLTIETANAELDEGYADSHANVVPGTYVMLAINDTGRGMDAATRVRVFEPFFTTKEHGKGSGLGLATVYGIVKQSGGYIWVYSEPGHGTAFKLYFPIAESRAGAQAATPARSGVGKRGSETVLLVEDEDAVRALACAVLRRNGYAVLEARHGIDALALAERFADEIHVMVTDVVMPHMSGRDLSERLTALRPSMKVLFMSGYTDHALVDRDLTPGSAFLQKPFTPDTLARQVRRVLDGAPIG